MGRRRRRDRAGRKSDDDEHRAATEQHTAAAEPRRAAGAPRRRLTQPDDRRRQDARERRAAEGRRHARPTRRRRHDADAFEEHDERQVQTQTPAHKDAHALKRVKLRARRARAASNKKSLRGGLTTHLPAGLPFSGRPHRFAARPAAALLSETPLLRQNPADGQRVGRRVVVQPVVARQHLAE
jgi:hypothetical protein